MSLILLHIFLFLRMNLFLFFSFHQIPIFSYFSSHSSFVLHEYIKLKLLNLFIVSIIMIIFLHIFCFSLSVIKHTTLSFYLSEELLRDFYRVDFRWKFSTSNPNLIPLTIIIAEKHKINYMIFASSQFCLNGFSMANIFLYLLPKTTFIAASKGRPNIVIKYELHLPFTFSTQSL